MGILQPSAPRNTPPVGLVLSHAIRVCTTAGAGISCPALLSTGKSTPQIASSSTQHCWASPQCTPALLKVVFCLIQVPHAAAGRALALPSLSAPAHAVSSETTLGALLSAAGARKALGNYVYSVLSQMLPLFRLPLPSSGSCPSGQLGSRAICITYAGGFLPLPRTEPSKFSQLPSLPSKGSDFPQSSLQPCAKGPGHRVPAAPYALQPAHVFGTPTRSLLPPAEPWAGAREWGLSWVVMAVAREAGLTFQLLFLSGNQSLPVVQSGGPQRPPGDALPPQLEPDSISSLPAFLVSVPDLLREGSIFRGTQASLPEVCRAGECGCPTPHHAQLSGTQHATSSAGSGCTCPCSSPAPNPCHVQPQDSPLAPAVGRQQGEFGLVREEGTRVVAASRQGARQAATAAP